MWTTQGDEKLVCPCGFDQESCIACSDFTLKAQRNVSQDGMQRPRLNNQELSEISQVFSKSAKSVEEREAKMVGKGNVRKYEDLSNGFRKRQLNNGSNRNQKRQRRRSLDTDREPRFLTIDEFQVALRSLFKGFPMNDRIFRALNTKKNGVIDFQEFLAACITIIRIYGFNVFCLHEESTGQ